MAIDRETLELRKRETELYRQYQNTWEYRMCRESGGQVSACFKLLVEPISKFREFLILAFEVFD